PPPLPSPLDPVALVLPLLSRPLPGGCTLSLHDALPISSAGAAPRPEPWQLLRAAHRGTAITCAAAACPRPPRPAPPATRSPAGRSEEHTFELQSRENLVCRLLL